MDDKKEVPKRYKNTKHFFVSLRYLEQLYIDCAKRVTTPLVHLCLTKPLVHSTEKWFKFSRRKLSVRPAMWRFCILKFAPCRAILDWSSLQFNHLFPIFIEKNPTSFAFDEFMV